MENEARGWFVGGTVDVDLHGTPAEGVVLSAPVATEGVGVPGGECWLVDVDGIGIIEVRDGRAV